MFIWKGGGGNGNRGVFNCGWNNRFPFPPFSEKKNRGRKKSKIISYFTIMDGFAQNVYSNGNVRFVYFKKKKLSALLQFNYLDLSRGF